MKFENYDKATELVKRIQWLNDKLPELEYEYQHISLTSGARRVIEYDINEKDIEYRSLVKDFVVELKNRWTRERSLLLDKLEKL